MSNHLTNTQLSLTMYPDPDVPSWLVARIRWNHYSDGAHLELRQGLSLREQLRAVAWAGAVLPNYLWPDGRGFAGVGDAFGPVLPVDDVGRYGRTIRLIACVDCGSDFDPDSSPHLDRCWVCAEDHDAETDQ